MKHACWLVRFSSLANKWDSFILLRMSKMAAYCRQTPVCLISCFLLLLCFCVSLVSSEYKLKDLEFNFKPGDPSPKIFTADDIAEYDGSDVSGRTLLPLMCENHRLLQSRTVTWHSTLSIYPKCIIIYIAQPIMREIDLYSVYLILFIHL